MHKSLMSEAESMAYTTTASPRDVKAPPQMAMVEPSSHGLSQNPVFMGAAVYPSRPNSWRTWRPSATFAQGLDPVPDDMQLPPPPPHALTGNRYPAFPPQARGSGVSTGEDSSMPEYGAWPPAASNADLTALTPAPGQAVSGLAPGYVAAAAAAAGPDRVQSRDYFRQQAEGAGGITEGDGHASYVTYSETPLATPRTPIVVEGEQLAPLATSQEASPVDNCDCDSGEGGDAGRGTRSDDIIWDGEQQQHHHRGLDSSGGNITITGGDGRVSRGGGFGGSGGDDDEPEGGGIQEAQLGREAGEGGGHGGGAQGVEAEPPGEQGGQQAEQGQQGEPGERGQQVLEEVAAVGGVPGQRGLRGSRRASSGRRSASSPSAPRAPSYWDEDSGSSGDRFSWSEAASEPYTAVAPAPTDGFGLSIIGAGRGSRSARAGDSARPGGDG